MRLRDVQVDYPGDPAADSDRRRAGAAAAAGTDTREAEEAGHSFADDCRPEAGVGWRRRRRGERKKGEG